MAASTGLSFLLWGMMGASIGALLPDAAREFSLTPLSAGLIFVVWSAGFTSGSLTVERLLRFGAPQALLAMASLLAASLSFMQVFAGTAQEFFALYALLGLCGGATFTASHTFFGEIYAARRSSALAALDVVFSAGTMAAPLAIIALLDLGLGWHDFYALLGVGFSIVALSFVIQVFAVRVFAVQVGSPLGRAEPPRGEGSPRREGVTDLPASTVASLAIASFSLGAIEWAQNVWSVTFLIEKGFASDGARLGLSAFTAGMIVCRATVAWTDGPGRSPATLWTMSAAALVGEASVVLSSGLASALIGNALLGLGIGGLFPIFLGRAMDRHPRAGAAISMLMIVSLTSGGQVASLALGALAQRFGVGLAFAVTLPAVVAMISAFEAARRRTVP